MNKLNARVTSIKTKDSINLIKLKSNEIILTLLTLDLPSNIKENSEVIALFKESEVVISKSESEGNISISNRIKGKILQINRGEIVSIIKIKTKIGDIDSMITTDSSLRLNLKVNDEIFALIKSNEMSMELK